MGYFATSLAICSMAAAFPYTLTPLFSTVSNKKLVGKSKDLALKFDNSCDEGGKVAESIAACLSVKKQLS